MSETESDGSVIAEMKGWINIICDNTHITINNI